MNLRSWAIVCCVLAGLSSEQAIAEILLEGAWLEVRTAASAANGTSAFSDQGANGLGGLGVTVTRQSIASLPGTNAAAGASASFTFDGASFITNGVFNTTTSNGVYPAAVASAAWYVDFRVTDSPASAPTWVVTGSNFTSSNPGYSTAPRLLDPVILRRDGGSYRGGALELGAYQTSMHIGIADNNYDFGGSMSWQVTGAWSFGAGLEIAPGFNQTTPLLPPPLAEPRFVFPDVPSGRWFDPPAVSEYLFEMTSGSLFTAILGLPNGFADPFEITVGAESLGYFEGGAAVDFIHLLGHSVSSFRVRNIAPMVDPSDPSAFPIQLSFDTPTASFTMTPVPEPKSHLSLVFGMVILSVIRAARQSKIRR